MQWNKLGHIFKQDGSLPWGTHSALTPTPILLNEDTIRVYAGFRDPQGISRIGYVDLESVNPLTIKGISRKPVLDIGRNGCFDDNGVILGDIVKHNDVLRMYYVGFQLVKKAKFLAFTGLAESKDNGETFERVSEAPVLDRMHGASTIRAIHTTLYEDGIWKIWYAAGDDWQYIKDIPYPQYNIWYTESSDGISFSQKNIRCVDVKDNEYRIGRPSVYKKNNQYIMFYTKASVNGTDYFPGVATSDNGIDWTRKDDELGLALSDGQFDSMHLCYPRLIDVNHKTYCIYNGNNMGAEGFGAAELLAW